MELGLRGLLQRHSLHCIIQIVLDNSELVALILSFSMLQWSGPGCHLTNCCTVTHRPIVDCHFKSTERLLQVLQ